MFVRFLSLLLGIALGAGLIIAKPQPWRQALRAVSLPTKMEQGLAKVAAGAKMSLAVALMAATLSAPSSLVAQDWQRVNDRSAGHLKSSAYLLLDAGDLWRVMHVEYLGMNADDEPLFVGLRAFTVMRDGKGIEHDILDVVEASLVGYDGLVEQGVDIEIKRVFAHPERRFLDMVVLTLAGVDMRDYEPIKVELWPMKALTELEMLSYRADLADNALGFFAYPAMRRSCVAGDFFVRQGIAMHTCVVPQNPASIASPLFAKDSGALVGIHIGYDEDGLPYAAATSPALMSMSDTILGVNPKQKAAVSWGEIKAPR